MAVQVIGAGVGRTGTYSLKLAINRLGFGPCHHMEAVVQDMPAQVPLWNAALKGRPDWDALYKSYASAVDWPTAGFFRNLIQVYPSAKFVLTLRDPENWADSFASTIYKLLGEMDHAPAHMHAWLEMAGNVVTKTGFPPGLDREGLIKAFTVHNEAVRYTIPASQLLVYDVKEGWGPLCEFLGVKTPTEAFPRTNSRTEFWDLVAGKTA